MKQAKTCSIRECGRKVVGRGWCVGHYGRWRRSGDPQEAIPLIAPVPNRSCLIKGCAKDHQAFGYCRNHYYLFRKHGDANVNKSPSSPGTMRDRFYRHVKKSNGCWLWTGSLTPLGYGRFGEHRGRTTTAHRISYRIHHGEILGGLHVLHKCDVRSCVNPGHLFLGTHSDNMKDMSAKGRARRSLTIKTD